MLDKKQALISLTLALLVFTTGCVPNNFTFEKEFGKSGSGSAEFLNPTDLDIDKEGNLVVADAGNTRFQVISTSGKTITTGGEFGVGKTKLQSISGIGVDKSTNYVLVCDQKGNKIVKYDLTDGSYLDTISKNMKYPMDVAVDSHSNIYAIMSRKSEIYKFSDFGQPLGKIGGQGKAALVFPTSILIYNDVIYITDFGGKRIVKLNLDGTFIEEIKTKGEYEEMKGPSGLHIDDAGNLYVLDLGEVPVVILSPDGKLISQVGTFGNHEGNFLYPTGVIAKSRDDVYVLDNTRNTVLNFVRKSK